LGRYFKIIGINTEAGGYNSVFIRVKYCIYMVVFYKRVLDIYKGLDQRLKKIGMKVSFDFKTVTTNKVETPGCNVTNPITYRVKELFIINQFKIR